MMGKLLSLRHWKDVIVKVSRILSSPRIPLREKLLFLVPVVLYWVLPDFMPFIPIDDIAVTMLLANVFANRIERKYSHLAEEEKVSDSRRGKGKKQKDAIDIEWEARDGSDKTDYK